METKLLQDIYYSFPFSLEVVKQVFRFTKSFDDTITILKNAISLGKPPLDIIDLIKNEPEKLDRYNLK